MSIIIKRSKSPVKMWLDFIEETLYSGLFAEKTPQCYMLFGALSDNYYDSDEAIFLTGRIMAKANNMPDLTDDEKEELKSSCGDLIITDIEKICNNQVLRITIKKVDFPSW